MIFSRIYQLAPSTTGEGVTLNAAHPGSNEDDIHDRLFDSLRGAFHSNARRQHGTFDPELPNAALQSAVAGQSGETLDAEILGLRLSETLKAELQGKVLPQAWYLWLIIDQSGASEVIYLFMLSHEEGFHFSAQHTVAANNVLRLDRLHYAAKLNVAEWRAGSDTCLTHLSPRNQNPVTLAWKTLVGFRENTEQSVKTEALLTAIDRYADQLPEEKEHEYRAKVAEYCLDQDRIGAPVEIRELSRHVDEEAPAALMDFLAEHIDEPAAPLYTDRRQLKRYTRLFGRDNNLSIGFSTEMLGNHIIYDALAGTLTIRNIPQSLKSQLARHSRKNSD